MQELIYRDRELLLFLNNLGGASYDAFWILMSEKWIWIPLYVIFLYLIIKNFAAKQVIFLLLFIAIGLTISDQLAGIFKEGIMRLRPCHDPELIPKMRLVLCGGTYGFYSSHASNSFFIANFLSILLYRKYKYLPYFLFFWAIVVSYSRIYLGVHFPLDIIFAAIVGFLLGGLFANLSLKVVNKQNQIFT